MVVIAVRFRVVLSDNMDTSNNNNIMNVRPTKERLRMNILVFREHHIVRGRAKSNLLLLVREQARSAAFPVTVILIN